MTSWNDELWFADLLKFGVTNVINNENKTVEYFDKGILQTMIIEKSEEIDEPE